MIEEVDMHGEEEISFEDFARMMYNLFSSHKVAYSTALKSGNFLNFKKISATSMAHIALKMGNGDSNLEKSQNIIDSSSMFQNLKES